MVYGSLVGFSIFPWQVPKKFRSPCKQNIIFLMCDIWNMKTRHYLLKLRFLLHVSIVKWWKNGAQKFRDFWISNLWQRWTTQTSFILKFSVSGKISYINFFSIRINQVNLKLNFCLVLCSKMVFYEEFYPVIFHFEIQKKHLKHLKIWIYLIYSCVNYQLQPHDCQSQYIFTIRPSHSALGFLF